MSKTVVLTLNSCKDCPFFSRPPNDIGYCSHPNSKDPQLLYLPGDTLPKVCPLRKKPHITRIEIAD